MAKLQTKAELEGIIRKYKKRLGIDPTQVVFLRIVEDVKPVKSRGKRPRVRNKADAWIDTEPSHPIHYISVRRSYLSRNKSHPRYIIRTLVHELLHIVVGNSFARLKPSYNYEESKQGMVEETLVMQLARAVVPVNNDELYENL